MVLNPVFYLSELDITVDASLAKMAGFEPGSFEGDATAEFDLPVDFLRELFQYHTDASDVDDFIPTDTLYKLAYGPEYTQITSNFIEKTIVTAGNQDSLAGAQDLARDYVRYLALKLFRHTAGVDLFDNETELRNNLHSSCRTALHTKLVGIAGYGPLDADGKGPGTEGVVSPNPAYKLLQEIIHLAPQRLNESAISFVLASDSPTTGNNKWYQMPLVAGDAICFLLHVDAHDDQLTVINSPQDVADIPTWTYLIKMNAV